MARRRSLSSACWLLAPLGAALAGCGPTDAPAVAYTSTTVQQPIQGGYLDDFDTAVVFIAHVTSTAFGGCTGSLLAPNVVLTAQHCVAPTLNQVNGGVICGTTTFGNLYPADDMWVTTATSAPMDPQAYVRGAEIHVPQGGPSFCGRDQAIIILQQPIDPAQALPIVPRVDEPLMAGEIYSAVGFGQLFDSPNAQSGTRYRRDGLRVECVDEGCPGFNVVTPEWAGETAICSGDSGGPALDPLGRVTGVASRGTAGCDDPIYGNVQGHGGWISEITIHAAGLMGVEPPAWATGWPTDPAYSQPVGGACDLPEQCPSGICVDGYCTRLCNDRSPCPEEFECAIDSGLCIQTVPPGPTMLPAPDPSRSVEEAEGSCSIAPRTTSDDPTKPIPWALGAGMLAGLTVLRRRRRR